MNLEIVPSEWVINGVVGNPRLTVVRGRTYTFNVAEPAQLFSIHSTPGGSAFQRYDTGVTGQATNLLTWTVPLTAPNTLYYRSEVSVTAPFGDIFVVSASVSYTARFYNDSATCDTVPLAVVTNAAGTCFANPFNPQFGFIKYETVNDTVVSGGGYSDAACATTVAPLRDTRLGECSAVAQIPSFSVRIDLAVVTTTVPAVTSTVTPPTIVVTTPTVPAGTTSAGTATEQPSLPASGQVFVVAGMDLGASKKRTVCVFHFFSLSFF